MDFVLRLEMSRSAASKCSSYCINSAKQCSPCKSFNWIKSSCNWVRVNRTVYNPIFKYFRVEITSVDIDDSKKEQSLLHGSNSFFSLEEFYQVNTSYEFENVFIVTPAIEKELWKIIGNNSRSNSNVVMVGAADLNCPRDIFYKKQLNFISPHSYGPGRGLYDFEILRKDFLNSHKHGT